MCTDSTSYPGRIRYALHGVLPIKGKLVQGCDMTPMQLSAVKPKSLLLNVEMGMHIGACAVYSMVFVPADTMCDSAAAT